MDFDRDGGNTIVSQIQQNIRDLSQTVQTLDGFVTQLSDSSQMGERRREEFNDLVSRAQQNSKKTNQLMKQLVELSNSERSMRIHRERLQNEYISVLNKFQAAQRRAALAEKTSMRQVREAAAAEQEERYQQEEQRFGQQGQQLQLQRHQQVNIEEIKHRQQALNQLEQDITDVNQIFVDLARIVHEQGEAVDSIEANVEHAQIHVEQAATNLQQAVHYNQKARQKKMLLCLFVTLLLFIIGLTVYLAA